MKHRCHDSCSSKWSMTYTGTIASPTECWLSVSIAPILAVADRRSRVVPSASVDAYQTGTASNEVQLLDYPGDMGVLLQHVGVLVGERAHRTLWPQIIRWMQEHQTTLGSVRYCCHSRRRRNGNQQIASISQQHSTKLHTLARCAPPASTDTPATTDFR